MGRFLDWWVVNAVGALGGLVVFWDSRVMALEGLEKGSFIISCRFRNLDDNFVLVFIGIYDPTENTIRELLWVELGAIRGLWEDSWCLGGGFLHRQIPRRKKQRGKDNKGYAKVFPSD